MPSTAAPTRSSVARTGLLAVAAAAVVLLLAGCAAGPNELAGTGEDPAGFWFGLWHGFISPVTFVVGLFRDDVTVFEVQNNGNWYVFGFMLGVAIVFSGPAGGGAGARRDRR